MSQINEMIQRQLQHRTIREFKDTSIPREILEALMEVARRTATSNGTQQFSIIRVTDSSIKKEIAEVCNQEYVGRAPELLIFIADQFRNNKIIKEKGAETENASDMDRFFQGFTDACLAAQNVVNASESMDLGVVFLGSILNDSAKICKILKLPKLTFPVVGLGIGYSNQNPQLKPRFDNRLRIFENSYTIFDNYLEEMKEYDEEMTSYFDLRNANRRIDCFSDQVVSKISNSLPNRQDILKVIQEQGFKTERCSS
ncbi:nitroreductase [Sedimentibacter acidaminivorans]|jgi:nitroreductase|uniref:Nitroreductase n=1 Tax=Sedimentibacter acidaminivorans TaxID=913099 RepID=A0ABS4GBZ0_9FIRM|nr:NADPH-dependent oxidoreductase [Sedimentibacter acidaminivorans]MBP1925205.1 nitroreductase [Sedimentibacter acidaminivorans]